MVQYFYGQGSAGTNTDFFLAESRIRRSRAPFSLKLQNIISTTLMNCLEKCIFPKSLGMTCLTKYCINNSVFRYLKVANHFIFSNTIQDKKMTFKQFYIWPNM